MVLSTGTLNLKFMQRAAARAAKDEPSAPATPSASASAVPSTPASPAPSAPSKAATPASAPAATPAPAAPAQDDEAGAKWVLPRRNAEAGPGPSTRPRVQFVASYLPFLEDEDAPSGRAPGRMSFGMVPKREEKEQGGDDDGGEFMSDSDNEVAVRRDKKPVSVGLYSGRTDSRRGGSLPAVSCRGPSRVRTNPHPSQRRGCTAQNRVRTSRLPRQRSAPSSGPKASHHRPRTRARARRRTSPGRPRRGSRRTRRASSTRRRARFRTPSTPSSRTS